MNKELIFISDTHTKHSLITQQLLDLHSSYENSILIHSGDISYKGKLGEVMDFLQWFSGLPFKHKIMISGNHDFLFERESSLAKDILRDQFPNVTYLQDSGVEIDGLKIWGSPITPWFYDWAFNRFDSEINLHWDMIPEDTEVLITHGPPYKILDKIYSGLNVGCPSLSKRITNLPNLKIHAFGHIHEANGTHLEGNVIYVNSSIVNLDYEVSNHPILIKL